MGVTVGTIVVVVVVVAAVVVAVTVCCRNTACCMACIVRASGLVSTIAGTAVVANCCCLDTVRVLNGLRNMVSAGEAACALSWSSPLPSSSSL